MSDRLAAIRERHAAKQHAAGGPVCAYDAHQWPCDTAVVLEQLEAANEDAARLAERVMALDLLLTCYRLDSRPTEALHRRLDRSENALAAHDQRVKP